MSEIKFVYFDLGNVILNFSHQVMVDNVAKVASIDAALVRTQMFDSNLENRYETGELNSQQFHDEFCKLVNADCDLKEFLDACGDIFWLKSDMVPVISQLWTVSMPLGILSNTCKAHLDAAKRNFHVLGHFFDTVITSYQSKSMKPDPKIYTDAIAAAGVDAGSIFFTDDKAENVDAAIKAGMDAVIFESANQLTRELRNRAILIG